MRKINFSLVIPQSGMYLRKVALQSQHQLLTLLEALYHSAEGGC